MRSLMRLFRTFSSASNAGRTTTGRRSMGRSRGMGTTAGTGSVGSLLRRFLR